MKNKKKWDILILSGNFDDIDMLSSYINDDSLGSYIEDNKQSYFFDIGKKDFIEDILTKHINRFDVNFTWEIKEEEDWHLNWKDNFKPIRISDELMIIPDWDDNLYDCKSVIKIRPGMAFGTGHHETTFLMLKHLINNINENDSVLDLGSGSGILSIVSHLYGAKKNTAVEFDLDCKDNFIENMEINNIKMDSIELVIEDVLCFDDFNYDIILANINKNIIKELIPKFKTSNAMILLSGILEEDREDIISLIEFNGIRLLHEDKYNEWLLMVIQNA